MTLSDTSNDIRPIKRALISLSDKSGIVEFARELQAAGVELLSTGGTFRLLESEGIEVVEVSKHTGFPEMMDGRVKTLHPTIHGGILGRRGTDDEVMATHGIAPIDLVLVNLYPFEATIANPDCSLQDAVENIDIGGPTMVRAAAKNHRDVAIVVNSGDYGWILDQVKSAGGLSLQQRFDLAIRAFEHTAGYDSAIANYFGQRVEGGSEDFPRTQNLNLRKAMDLRYGENPHQRAAFYHERNPTSGSISSAVQHQGKELSYNNIADTDAALECVKQFEEPACVIVKHANPCGVAVAASLAEAYQAAFKTDQESAFGGIIAFNRKLEGKTLAQILDQQFVEVVIAPELDASCHEIAASKKNVRLLSCGSWDKAEAGMEYKRVAGGFLLQDRDQAMVSAADLKQVSKRAATQDEIRDALFAWKVGKFVKSNAIVYCQGQRTIGVGAGQMSRVNSARIAAIKAEQAGLEVAGSVMASDAFFPFRDGIDNAAAVGVRCVIQPGGSIRDDEVIAAADEHDMAMLFTGVRHFRH